MLKWVGGIASALFIAVLSTMALAALRGPLDDWFGGTHLNARIDFTPWVPKPDDPIVKKQKSLEGEWKAKKDDTAKDKIYKEALRDLVKIIVDGAAKNPENPYADPLEFQLVRITIDNQTSKVVNHISIRIDGVYKFNEGMVVYPDGRQVEFRGVSQLQIPDLAPGKIATVFSWGSVNYSPDLFNREFKTFSSVGSMRVSINAPALQTDVTDSAFDRFMEQWFPLIWIALVVFGWLFTWVGYQVYERAYRALIKNESYYQTERQRWLSKPKGFEPDFKNMPKD